MHEVLVNRLGGLSLPRKSVVRLTDRPDMTLDVYRGRKTTIPQHFKRTGHNANDISVHSVEKVFIYEKNSFVRFKIVKKHETELQWIKYFTITFFHWYVMIHVIFTMKAIFRKWLISMCFLFWNFVNGNPDFMAPDKREITNKNARY